MIDADEDAIVRGLVMGAAAPALTTDDDGDDYTYPYAPFAALMELYPDQLDGLIDYDDPDLQDPI